MIELEKEYDLERAKLDEISTKQEEKEREYQKLIDVLKTPINVKYEYEYKKSSLFSEERYKTDNVIISKKLLDSIDKQAKLGQKIGTDYYELRNDLKVPKYQKKIQQQQADINKKASVINKQNEMIQVEREGHEKTKERLESIRKGLAIAKEMFSVVKTVVGEKIYHNVIDKIDNHFNYRKGPRTLMTTDEHDKVFFENKDYKIRQSEFKRAVEEMETQKDKGFER